MLGTETTPARAPLLAPVGDEAHATAQVLCDRLRRLTQLRALFARVAPEDLDRAMADALPLVPARTIRLVEVRSGGPPVPVAAWPDAARDLPPPSATAVAASLENGAPAWLEPDAVAASPDLASAAALLGVEAWAAIPLCAGAVAAVLELGLAPAPRRDATERGYLAVAGCIAGGALLRARSGAAEAGRVAEAEARARRHAGELESTLQALPIGVLLVRGDGAMERINSAAGDLLGMGAETTWTSAADALACLAVEWPDGRQVTFSETPLARARRGEVVRDVLLTFQPRDQARRWIVVNAVPLGPSRTVPAVVATILDVTRTRELEIDRQELLEQLFHGLAPQLRRIAERAASLQAGGDPEKAIARAAEIVAAVRRMTSGLRELETALRFDARTLAASPELVDVKAFVLDLLERLAADVDVSRVVLSAAPEPLRAHVDPDHLERLLVELLRGALAGAAAESSVLVRCGAAHDRLRITVASSGQDIGPEELPRVFDRFFRARGRPAGRLYLVRSLAEASRGRVSAESGPDRGLAIHVDLPLGRR